VRGGGRGAAALAEVGDAVHALVHRRVGAETGLDAVPARRVAPAGHRVQALAPPRLRLGAPAAAVAARPRSRRRLAPARKLPSSSSSLPSALNLGVVVVVVVPVAGLREHGEKGECQEEQRLGSHV